MDKRFNAMRAAANLEKIEFHLGRKVSGGIINLEDLGEKNLSGKEAREYATQIDKIEFYRKDKRVNNSNSKSNSPHIVEQILYFIIGAFIVAGVINAFLF